MTEGRSRTDPDLIRAVQAGSEAALEALYQRYLPSVWRYVYTQVRGDAHAAEDVVGETFLAAVAGLQTLDPDGGSLYAWLMGVARHKLGDHRRRTHRNGSDSAAASPQGVASSNGPDPSGALLAAETGREVAAAMAALPDDERIVLEWKYLDDLSVRHIATRLGRTEKAVQALLYRARKSFRAIFGRL